MELCSREGFETVLGLLYGLEGCSFRLLQVWQVLVLGGSQIADHCISHLLVKSVNNLKGRPDLERQGQLF